MADPSLDDLIEAHRGEVHLGDGQLSRARARVLARAGAGVAVSTLATGVAARSASHGAVLLVGKMTLGLALIGGLGSAYYYSRSVPALGVVSKPAPALGGRVMPPLVMPVQAEIPSVPAGPAPEPPSPNVAPSPVARASAPPRPSAPTGKRSSLADEVRAMQAVDGALRSGNAAQALQLLDQAPADTGGMAEERAAARVFALCRLSHVTEARRAAIAFARQWPKSPLALRVAASCAE